MKFNEKKQLNIYLRFLGVWWDIARQRCQKWNVFQSKRRLLIIISQVISVEFLYFSVLINLNILTEVSFNFNISIHEFKTQYTKYKLRRIWEVPCRLIRFSIYYLSFKCLFWHILTLFWEYQYFVIGPVIE